jgi:hypothetical protein
VYPWADLYYQPMGVPVASYFREEDLRARLFGSLIIAKAAGVAAPEKALSRDFEFCLFDYFL